MIAFCLIAGVMILIYFSIGAGVGIVICASGFLLGHPSIGNLIGVPVALTGGLTGAWLCIKILQGGPPPDM
jgi:hypothetical protein